MKLQLDAVDMIAYDDFKSYVYQLLTLAERSMIAAGDEEEFPRSSWMKRGSFRSREGGSGYRHQGYVGTLRITRCCKPSRASGLFDGPHCSSLANASGASSAMPMPLQGSGNGSFG